MSDALAALRGRFIDRCGLDLEVIERELEAQTRSPPAQLRDIVHKLSGAAGLFGYTELSESARRVDDLLTDGDTPSAADLGGLARELRKVCGSRDASSAQT